MFVNPIKPITDYHGNLLNWIAIKLNSLPDTQIGNHIKHSTSTNIKLFQWTIKRNRMYNCTSS